MSLCSDRSDGTVSKPWTELRSPNDLPVYLSGNVLLCFLNPTSGPSALGTPILNDGEVICNIASACNYQCFAAIDFTAENAKELLCNVLCQKYLTRLMIYYSGHGATAKDVNGDEDDGQDELFCFKGGNLLDDDIAEIFNENVCGNYQIKLISDCCHSGTIYDIDSMREDIQQLQQRIQCISACADHQYSYQLIKNGMFTCFLNANFDKQTKRINLDKIIKCCSNWNQSVKTWGEELDEIFVSKLSGKVIEVDDSERRKPYVPPDVVPMGKKDKWIDGYDGDDVEPMGKKARGRAYIDGGSGSITPVN